jgi:hypothetical protein
MHMPLRMKESNQNRQDNIKHKGGHGNIKLALYCHVHLGCGLLSYVSYFLFYLVNSECVHQSVVQYALDCHVHPSIQSKAYDT